MSSQPDDIIKKLREIKLTMESIRDHSIDEYYTILGTSFNFFNIKNTHKEGHISVKISNLFYPKITSAHAELHNSDKPRIVINIKGHNLNFLSEPAVELKHFTSNIVHCYLVPAMRKY